MYDINYPMIVTIVIIVLFVILSIFLIWNGYSCTHNDDTLYGNTIGLIKKKTVETQNVLDRSDNIIIHNKKFRSNIEYEFMINNIKYNGQCYNFGLNDDFLDFAEYDILHKSKSLTKIFIYYSLSSPHINSPKIENMQKSKSKIYYAFAMMLLFSIPIIIFWYTS